ncbi:MAG: FtsW/RodA/SpoVE family cell cycle protein [Planctomycetes bacterium]|nr:FtsW/RodA/SpoVE family cell cycle protein [Planctomycetota bacterium]
MSGAAGRAGERRTWVDRVVSLRAVRWSDLDWHVVALSALLLGVGLVLVATMSAADEAYGRADVRWGDHLKKLLVAAPAFVLGLAARPRWLRRNALAVWVLVVALLLAVFVVGDARNGARRWIDLGPFDLQPSELAKVAVILGLAAALDHLRLRSLREWGAPLALALVPMALVVLQPDLGTALTLVPITLGLLYVAGASGRLILAFVGGALALGLFAWQFEIGIRDYQLQRLDTWTRGWSAEDLIAERNGAAFHAYHARVAIGNGGLGGEGLGRGVSNEVAWLPERDCDSIFAVVAEELGWIGVCGILALYGLLVLSLFQSASGLRDRFSRLVVTGVAILFAAHLVVHCGVNLGLLPLTGLTLPLFSTGGSSLLATFLALGLALGLASHRQPSLDAETFRRGAAG